MTARRQTSSIETMSYFQRFSARMVRSRNSGVISLRFERLKAPGASRPHPLEPQDGAGAADGASGQPVPAAEIGQFQLQLCQ